MDGRPSTDSALFRRATFGRRVGRRLRGVQADALNEVLPAVKVDLPAEGMLNLAQQETWLEIGFRGGEHLAGQAQRHPDVMMIGCEPFLNGVALLLRTIRDSQIGNIRVFNDDARLLLEKLPDASLSRVFILFPDPWPKTRHHKRRFVCHETLAELWRVMKPGAELRIVSDHPDYVRWVLRHVLTSPYFVWTAEKPEDFEQPPVDWIPTRYQQKKARGAEDAIYIICTRLK